MKRRFIRVVPFFLILSVQIFAQIQDYKVYHLGRMEGLSQSTVNCIVRDSTGFMWFGTNDGLNKYSAYEFTHYKHQPGDSTSLGLGRVFSIFLDSRGRLWSGTDQGGLNLYDPELDNFHRFNHFSVDENVLISDIRAILESSDGKLWIASYEFGLWSFDPELKEFTAFPGENIESINRLCYDKEGNLWIGGPSGISILENGVQGLSSAGKLRLFELAENVDVLSLYCDSEGTVWIGTYGMGAYSVHPESGIITRYSSKQDGYRKLSHDIVRSFIDDLDGNLLIGTGGGGINILDKKDKRMAYMEHRLNYQTGLSSNIIYTFYRDTGQNLWIGTYNDGINVTYRHKDKFGHLKSYGGSNDLSNNSIIALTNGTKSNIWVGTDGGGLNYYDPETGTFLHFRHDPANANSISGDVVKSLAIDKQGVLWIGTFNAGLNAYNIAEKKFTHFYANPNSENSIAENHIWDIEIGENDDIWLATLGGGLDCYNKKKKAFAHFRNDPANENSLSNDFVSTLLFDSRGRLWAGTEFGGLNLLVDKERGVFQRFIRGTAQLNSISSNQVSTLFEDSKGRIWVGTTGGGLNLFNEKDSSFVHFDEDDGLANNLVSAILEDDKGNLWISTNNGLSCFIPPAKDDSVFKFRNYYIGDGLQSNEFFAHAACWHNSGMMYFGGANGISFFHPDKIDSNSYVPNVVLTDFKIFNKSVTPGEPGSVLEKSISQTNFVELSYKHSVITIEFASLDFNMPSQNNYKYMLEGFEEQWNNVGNQRSATYTNLDPGKKYLFRVKGSNNDNVWNEQGVSLAIYVKPPFRKTWVFRIALVVLATLFILSAYWIKVKSLQQNRKKLKELVNERTRELLELNAVLEQQNKAIQQHGKELEVQQVNLTRANRELRENQKKISQQNLELEKHRNHLEDEVKKRTRQLENAKLKAEEADKLKTAFLSNMSHEIRTPMNAIVGFSSLMSESDLSQSEREDFVKQINNNSESLLVLIDDILDLSKIESNQLSVNLEKINAPEFFTDLHKIFKYDQKKEVEVRFEIELAKNTVLFTDRIRLRQVLINLLNNALKFTEEGYVRLHVEKRKDAIHMLVEDTGIGIAGEDIERVFDRFYKLESPTEKLYRGAGLGLTITKKLVELLGGEIHVSSVQCQGSKFEFVLPHTEDN